MKTFIIMTVAFTLGMMLAHYQAEQWVGSKAKQMKGGYVCTK